MDSSIFALIILLVLLLVGLWCGPWTLVTSRVRGGTEGLVSKADSNLGTYIRLYEGFNQKNLALELMPGVYYKDILPINLKSVDINLPDILGGNHNRKIEIWSMYAGSPISSTEAAFYNSYLEPEVELKSNSAKYHFILQVLPGQHVRMNMDQVIKKILLIVHN
jgi:hypothetical protein